MEKEWENEPNFLEWYFGEIHCIIKRHQMGHLCGYAGVDKLHPLYDVRYEDLDVHGGVTYYGKDVEGMKENMFYFGFDCAHCYDIIPQIHANLPFHLIDNTCTYKNIEFVKQNVEELASQLYYHLYVMKKLIDDN